MSGRRARVTFNYRPEQDDELTLDVGDIIENIVDVDVGWCEGVLKGKKGMFPNNFVEELTSASEEVVPEPASSASSDNANTVAGSKKAKVTFDYEGQDDDELTLHVGDIVDFMCEVEEGWWRGQLNGKVGVFPSNFVELLDDKDVAQTKDKPVEIKKETPPSEKEAADSEDGAGGVEDDDTGIHKRHSSIGKSKNLLGGGMGFGNLINPNILAEKRLKRVHHDEKKEKKDKPEEKNMPTEAGKAATTAAGKSKAPLSAKSRPAPPVPASPPIVQVAKKPSERAKVMFDYEPENPDELKLTVGEVITIITKDIPENEGWWEGELNGKVGVFPTNFVELLPAGEEEASLKAPSLPPTYKKGFPVLPVKDEPKKSPKVQRKPFPSLPPKDESDSSDATPEPPPPAKPEVKKPLADPSREPLFPVPGKPKPPVAGQKPVLPPKKPLPTHKKPKGVVKKPDKKVDVSEETNTVALKKSSEKSAEKIAEVAKDHVDRKPAEKAPLKEEEVSKPPEIRTNDVEEGAAISFDDIPVTETLNHLTANRAKAPQKRPPSKDGRSTDSARLSGTTLDEQLIETIKQPPGRPKEAPKEPAWKKEVREAREKKQHTEEKVAPPLLSPKSDAVEKRKSLRDEVQVPLPVQKVEPFTTAPGEVEKLRKEVSELREIISKMEKSHSQAIKRLDDKFTREIEAVISDFDEERKHNAALKVEIDRLKRRQTRQDSLLDEAK